MTFGMMTHRPIGRYSGSTVNFEFLKIQDGGNRHFENHKKSRYLRNDLTDLYEIWFADAKSVS